MKKIRVVVADDQPDIAREMKRRVEMAASGVLSDSVIALAGEELKAAITELRRREQETAAKEDWSPHAYNEPIDKADVLVLDFDMSDLYGREAYMTGEVVASLARRYSRAGPIVSVNRFGGPQFDLRLRSTTHSWADLSVAHEDLENPGLWGTDWPDYRPWYWPVLSELPELFEKRAAFAYDHRDEPIADALAIPEVALRVMPSAVYDRLPDTRELTFLQLAREHIFSPKAPQPSMQQLVRTAAAEVSNWLSSTVLPGQDVLLDAPHIAALYPSLLTNRPTPATLNSLCVVSHEAEIPLRVKKISGQAFGKSVWLDRRAWWTELVLENSDLEENSQPWAKKELDYVFAEDASVFLERKDVVPFRAEGLLKRRYTAQPAEYRNLVTYRPTGRLVN